MKQWEIVKLYGNDDRVLDGTDYVDHAAYTKIVPTLEYNPFECAKTNIIGAMNPIDMGISVVMSILNL